MANSDALGLSIKWQKRQVDREKAAIKRELDAAAAPDDPSKRLSYLTQRIRKLEDEHTPLGQLRRFIYIISALVHHERHGGLSNREIESLAKIAHAILKTQGIQAKTSRLAFMHGELHLVLSQIYRKDGQHWLAAWEQQLGLYSAKSDPTGGKGFQALSMANRAIRLGNAKTALRLYSIAESFNPAPRLFEQCRLGRVLTLRLMGRTSESEALAEASLGLPEIAEPVRRELLWERAIREVQASDSMDRMLPLVAAGGSHREAGYLVDAALLAKVVKQREWQDRVPKARSMARQAELRPQKFGHLFKCLLQLDDCYDYDIPMPIRLSGLGEILSQTDKLISISSELLVWGAAVRWLNRSQTFAVALLVYDQYQALSLRLSGGDSTDVLGLLGDVNDQTWLKELESNQQE